MFVASVKTVACHYKNTSVFKIPVLLHCLKMAFSQSSSVSHTVQWYTANVEMFLTDHFPSFLDAFARLRKASVSFVMPVRPSVRTEQLGPQWTDVHEIRCLRIFRRSVDKIKLSLKSDKTKRVLHTKTDVHFFILSRSFLLRLRSVSD
jgi:hypothetical protein